MTLAAAVTLAAAASFRPAWQRRALAVIFALQVFEHLWVFPFGANHFFLETVLVGFAAFFDTEDEDERELFLIGVRWMTAIVLFYTGVQKVVHGTYFDGQFMAAELANGDRFEVVFRLLDPEEVERVKALGHIRPSAGPYRLQSPLLLAISNGVWIAELILPVLLLWRRTRPWALFVAAAFVLSLQLGAREVMFALLFTHLCLLFAERPYNRWLLRVAPLIYAASIAARIWFPQWGFN